MLQNPVVKITDQYDPAETAFLMQRYGLAVETVPEVLSLLEFAQDFAAAITDYDNAGIDEDAVKAARARRKERERQRALDLEALKARAAFDELGGLLEELQKLGFNVHVLG